MRRAALALTLAATASACAGGREEVGSSRAAVIDGVPDQPPKYDATLKLEASLAGGPLLCTATLISPHVAVTARHCVASYDGTTGFGANFPTSELHVRYGAEPSEATDNTVVRIVDNGAQYLPDNDLALLVLRDAAPMRPARDRAGQGRARRGRWLRRDGNRSERQSLSQ
jgi:hypothetical protein